MTGRAIARFRDGPAAKESLQLSRLPLYLRVVRGQAWDALDRLDDEPAPGESVYAYERVGGPTQMHLYCPGKGPHRSGWYVMQEYRFVAELPGDEGRVKEKWQQWAIEQVARKSTGG
jgi:hypothetical protein